ncbi:Zn-dependent hydrolase [Thalassobacillus devorans]|uniref:Zn-dependent hydrolase n=1 Tax=Thalassobacillus devorans TaxID=279813 RepID=A0ABQ1NKZ0_9BACI|nr:Zn-dependent hydrolase [Thalassobacillus devorans]NIK27312.1 allantoate deiminase [Thalassobacillus devorans]GGC76697.1 Zn-dependent hydrolase [Thalassobacillus devorans]
MDKRVLEWKEAYEMLPRHHHLPIDRFIHHFNEINSIGSTGSGGNSRFPYTKEYREAVEIVKERMKAIGMSVHEDAIGNVYGKVKGIYNHKSLMLGSHIDTVPDGGMFDGLLGVVSALAAVESFIEQNGMPKWSIEVAVFVDEEGSRFNHGLFGSRAMAGEINKETLDEYKDDQGVTIAEAMKADGLQPEQLEYVERDLNQLIGYLELHIEQGIVLDENKEQIGVVEGIAGPARETFTFTGSADHAGNTPMHMRKDALIAASQFIAAIEKLPEQFSETAVATVGKITNFPNGTNVVPGKTEVTVDIRDTDAAVREELIQAIKYTAKRIADTRGLTLEVSNGIRVAPVQMDENMTNMIEEASKELNLAYRKMPSGAGHDAMILGNKVPTGMIFVPSRNGKSHTPEEWTSLSDCLDGILVMERTLGKILSNYNAE